MADTSKLEAQIRALEARRAAGESVPQLDALYDKMDALTNKGYEEATKAPTGERPAPATPAVKKAKGGSVGSASKRADGIAQRGKTRGRMC